MSTVRPSGVHFLRSGHPMARGWRVLIIEDDSSVAELYASKLRRGGYEVDVARDGVSGFDLASSLLPDAIILDIHLPRLSGLAALAVLRKEEATSGLPVVVLSNYDAPAVLGESRWWLPRSVRPESTAWTSVERSKRRIRCGR